MATVLSTEVYMHNIVTDLTKAFPGNNSVKQSNLSWGQRAEFWYWKTVVVFSKWGALSDEVCHWPRSYSAVYVIYICIAAILFNEF
jgi:hypothetical protein